MAEPRRGSRGLTALGLGLMACHDPVPPPPHEDLPVVVDLGADPTAPSRSPGSDPFASPGLLHLRPRPRLGWPVHSVHITSSFGWRVDPVSGRGTRLHRGLDLRGAIGDLVLSIGDGRVEFAGHDPLLGTMVIIDHGDGLTSVYGHLSDVLVVSDAPVQRGAAIGLVGNTGRSAAPHLHLTVKLDGRAIDPLEVIGEPQHRPAALATPEDAPVGDPSAGATNVIDATSPTEAVTATDDPAPIPVPSAPPGTSATVDGATRPPPLRHPLPHRSDDGGEP
ncbi:MAG: M23 family metallopeptidase [Myxococcota bacterium]